MTLVVLLVLLAACGTGNADESVLYENSESTKVAQMPITQATTTARFFAGTPVPGPTWTPIAVLSDIALSTSVNGDNSPRNEVGNAPGQSVVYATAKVHAVSAGTVFTAIWGRTDGSELSRSEQVAQSSANSTWFAFEWNTSGQGGGDYAVFIYADSMLIGSLAFSVG